MDRDALNDLDVGDEGNIVRKEAAAPTWVLENTAAAPIITGNNIVNNFQKPNILCP